MNALDIYKKNLHTANQWFGDSGQVSALVTDIFPNMRNGELESVQEDYEPSNEPILVYVDKTWGVLIIEDGHHRYAKALREGKKRMDVIILGEKSHFIRIN